ncbi:MAG TPA: DUF512 domain-containing protein [Anaerolineae bacterium]|nr:DUF512 domain-containing protein [Anaerolineae bacterium]HOR00429.1 DUF512 domain-containing protein [Anaerolineae bacterium]
MTAAGGQIVALAPGGLGEALGLRAGDRLLRLNGHALRDVIDLQFYGAEETVALALERGGRELEVQGRRRYGQGWGVEFAEPLFDGLRTCGNHCPFCFVTGLPPGLRPSLYVRDDDYRLSFLQGNFCTLADLSERDWQRLAEQRLSPLYVSVQATEPDLRRRLLGGRPIPDVREQIRRLGELGIGIHAQVVICPGLNDGAALEQTVADLWALREAVESVALVPVGLTSHHPLRLRPMTAEQARAVLTLAGRRRRRAFAEEGRRFVYPSDEMYLLAGRPLPVARTYDGFPQLANGVGLLRRFIDGWKRQERTLSRPGAPAAAVRSATLVSGRAFLPFLEPVAAGLARLLGIGCRALGVENRLFGGDVTVAGLLAAQDVLAALQGQALGERVVLPRSMFDAAGERTLDDWTLERLTAALSRPVAIAGTPAELVAALVA